MTMQHEQQQGQPGSAGDEKTLELIQEAVLEGMTLKDAHGIPDEMMASLYAYAYDFYDKGQLEQAETFFRFLCLYDFYNTDYIMGLAAVYQLKKRYDKAIGLYAVAFGLDGKDYRPMFYTGQCHLFERKAAKARQCFEIVAKDSKDAALIAKSQAYLQALAKKGGRQDAAATEATESTQE